jgi:hypothetical protein
VIYKREISNELDSCARELEELGLLCHYGNATGV